MNHDRIDILIDAVVSGDASTAQWNELVGLSERDPAVWRALAEAQRQERALAATMDRAVRIAERVEAVEPHPTFHFPGRWAGWAVAAMLVVAWAVGIRPASPNDQTHTAGVGPRIQSASDAYQEYITRGQQERLVVQEVPTRIMVETRAIGDGQGFEVLYIRQILERTTVPDLYHFGAQDEAGRPTLVRYQPPVREPM